MPREPNFGGRGSGQPTPVHWSASAGQLAGWLPAASLPLYCFFLSFIVILFFLDFKKVVVCWSVGPWVLFYLVSQSNEPTIGEGEACEIKNWREE